MASGMMSDYLANALNDHSDGVAVYTPPTQIWLGLYTARGSVPQSCAGTNFVSVAGGGFAEINIGVGSANWNASAARSMANKLAIAMGTPSLSWGDVKGYTLKDQSGNLLWWQDLDALKPCPAGVPVSFAAGAIVRSLPQGS